MQTSPAQTDAAGPGHPVPIALDSTLFAAAFPFHIGLDCDMRIFQHGRSIGKACPDVRIGNAFGNLFSIVWPSSGSDYESVASKRDRFFLIEHIGSKMRLRGQFVVLPGSGALAFLGSPWITRAQDLETRGLTFEDFALHDPVIDMLQVLQASQQAVEDAKALALSVEQQAAQLREANAMLQRLSLVVKLTDDAAVVTDSKGNIEWANDAFTRLTGYSLEEAIGRSPGRLMQGPGSDPQVVDNMMNCMQLGRPFKGEILNYHKSGRPYWLALEIQPVRNKAGEIVNYTSIKRDVTDERNAKQRHQLQYEIAGILSSAHRAEDALNAIVSTICEVLGWPLAHIWTVSGDRLQPSGRWSASANAFLAVEAASPKQGFGKGEGLPGAAWAAGKTRWMRLSDEEHRCPRARVARESGLLSGITLPIYVQDECQLVLEFFARTEYAPDDLLTNTLQATATHIGQFLARVDAENSLRRARDAAETANQAKSRFVATMSHEIRTPLNAVIGIGSLMADMPMEREQRHYLRVIRESSDQLLSIVNDVLDLSRLESGQMVISNDDFDLEAVVRHVITIALGLADKDRITISSHVAPEVPRYLRGDASRVSQVLINLMGNAIKFTARGSVRLEITRAQESADGITVAFSVRDTGCGIPASEFDRIFQPFEQIGREASSKGSGLGLAICRRIADRMGGRMTLDSRLGEGSTFSMVVPLQIGAPPDHPAGPDNASLKTRSLRILVADDTPASLLVIRGVLERLGHSVHGVADGKSAVLAFESESFDAVFLDIQMPVMDGLEAATHIRRSPRGASLPVIGLSAFAQESDKRLALARGMSHYLTKPIKLVDVARLMQSLSS